MTLILKEEAYQIMGACFEVYNQHRAGFLESVYHESLQYEFADQKIPAVSEPQLQVQYKSRILKSVCRPDFVCFGKIIVEIKAIKALDNAHRAQVLNYLKATGFKLGLLVNFGHPNQLQWERIVLSSDKVPPNLHQ